MAVLQNIADLETRNSSHHESSDEEWYVWCCSDVFPGSAALREELRYGGRCKRVMRSV